MAGLEISNSNTTSSVVVKESAQVPADSTSSPSNAGITAQYGFEFQKLVYVYTILNTHSVDNTYIYEGIDDVEINTSTNGAGDTGSSIPSDYLCRIEVSKGSESTAIQVKSGDVGKESFAKVIGNWILSGAGKALLLCEHELPFGKEEFDTINYVVNYFQNGKEHRKDSIANKVYRKLGLDKLIADDGSGESNEDDFNANTTENVKSAQTDNTTSPARFDIRTVITGLIHSAQIKTIDYDQLDTLAEETFIKYHCDDIKVYDRAKHERYLAFREEIKSRIDESMSRKEPCVLGYQDIVTIFRHVSDEISDHKYEIDVKLFTKRNQKTAEKLVEDKSTREIAQLFNVNPNPGFVIQEVVKELLYKDFRNVFVDSPKKVQISSLEVEASSNHMGTVYEYDQLTPREDFFKTVSKELHSELMPESSLYRNGCYIYMTSEDIPDDQRITWGSEGN